LQETPSDFKPKMGLNALDSIKQKFEVVDDEYKVKDLDNKDYMKPKKIVKLTKNKYDFNKMMKNVSYSNSPRY
jgi:hypothetical protein